MQDSNFNLGEDQWYETKSVQANDFLNQKLQSTQYGTWYSVGFVGSADSYLWLTKTEPAVGEKYWGHLEKTASGKAVKFKWDKQNTPSNLPNGEPTAYTAAENEKGDSITASMVTKLAFQGFIQAEGLLPQEQRHWSQIEYMAEMLYGTIQKVKSPKAAAKPEDQDWMPSPEELAAMDAQNS
jgi:hypothetical protein